jgi:uncharacterized protein
MICGSTPSADAATTLPRRALGKTAAPALRAVAASLVLLSCWCAEARAAHANPLTLASAAYARGDYVSAVNTLTPPALRGNPNAQAFLGFMYENGYGAPQAYVAAADLYVQAATSGNPFGQAMLGLMYDKGHGVPQDFTLAYKWLNLAAARAPRRERDYFLRLRNAVASKMSPTQIAEGQRLALLWAPGRP